ncbi:hypothetical protein KVT40_007912 [Elsinoe batatas]|uniref:Uncharacterized protein n=1 Tax=Elsinoe batatas TaxID=2601811 RepID=A0A8K0KX12_9PEZI|nr:hypothetical protein KVT40_007912 [Elsinoe batatas]
MTTTYNTDNDNYEQQIQEIVLKSFQLGQQNCPPTTIVNKHIRDHILRLIAITFVNWLIHELTAYYYAYAADDPSSTTSTRNRATNMRNVRDRFRRFTAHVMLISVLGIAWHKEFAFRLWFGWNITRFLRFSTALMACVALEVMSMTWTIITSLKRRRDYAVATEGRYDMNDLRPVSSSPCDAPHKIRFSIHKTVLNCAQHAVNRDTDTTEHLSSAPPAFRTQTKATESQS